MTTPNKPREWWIEETSTETIANSVPYGFNKPIHVVEYAALREAEAEIERLRYQGADYWKAQYDELKRSIGLAELKYDVNTNSATGWMVKYTRQQEENKEQSALLERATTAFEKILECDDRVQRIAKQVLEEIKAARGGE